VARVRGCCGFGTHWRKLYDHPEHFRLHGADHDQTRPASASCCCSRSARRKAWPASGFEGQKASSGEPGSPSRRRPDERALLRPPRRRSSARTTSPARTSSFDVPLDLQGTRRSSASVWKAAARDSRGPDEHLWRESRKSLGGASAVRGGSAAQSARQPPPLGDRGRAIHPRDRQPMVRLHRVRRAASSRKRAGCSNWSRPLEEGAGPR